MANVDDEEEFPSSGVGAQDTSAASANEGVSTASSNGKTVGGKWG